MIRWEEHLGRISESENVSCGAKESIENRYERKRLIGNNAEFENDARLNREPVKRFQRDRMAKPKRPCDNPS